MVFNEHLQTYSNKSGENMVKLHQVYEKELGLDKPFKPKLNHKRNKSLLMCLRNYIYMGKCINKTKIT